MQCGHADGTDRLHLRLPSEVVHQIDGNSPLASWHQPGGLSADADSEIVVVVTATLHTNSLKRLRSRSYSARRHVRCGYTFVPLVCPPTQSRCEGVCGEKEVQRLPGAFPDSSNHHLRIPPPQGPQAPCALGSLL